MRLISKILLLYLFFFSFQTLAVKEDLTEKDELAGDVKDSAITSKQTCSLLVDWVNSDFKDKTFSIGFSNTSRKCLAENKKAHDKLTENKQASIIETKNLGAFYSEKFKHKLLESYQDKYLSPCQSPSLDDFKKRALQTRFYASAAKIEAVNSNIVDEIAYYDSVLPSPNDSSLMGINCKTAAFLEINNKCVEYKKQTKDCKENQSKRFENIIEKTKVKLAEIVDLEKKHRSCLTNVRFKNNSQSPPQTNEDCKRLFQTIELIKDQIPWVRGEVFNSIALKIKPNNRNNYKTEYDEKKIVQAVSDQLHKNRQALVRTFNTNDKNFECLISNNVNDPECDFTKIRSHLASQPDVKASDIFTDNTKEGQEGALQLESDQCLIKYEDDLYQLHNTVKEVGYTVVLTAATLGVGWASGLKAINSMSKLGRSLAIANGTFGAVASGVDLKHTYQECSQESKLIIDLSAKSNLTKENVCSKDDSPLSQAQEKETDCLLGALLSAPGILPFLGSTPGLMKLASASASRSAKSVENVSEPISSAAKSADNIAAPVKRSAESAKRVPEEVLKSNAQQMQNLVDANDLDGARALIRSQMKATSGIDVNDHLQVEGILNAHIDPKAKCAIGECTPNQLEEKRKIMKEAGLSLKARRDAIERGLAGNPPSSPGMKSASLGLSQAEAVITNYGLNHSYASLDPSKFNLTDQLRGLNQDITRFKNASVNTSRFKRDDQFDQASELLIENLTLAMNSKSAIKNPEVYHELLKNKDELLMHRLNVPFYDIAKKEYLDFGISRMTSDQLENSMDYLKSRLKNAQGNLNLEVYKQENALLAKMENALKQSDLRAAEAIRIVNAQKNQQFVNEQNLRTQRAQANVPAAAPLTDNQKKRMASYTKVLNGSLDKMNKSDIDGINQLASELREKQKWANGQQRGLWNEDVSDSQKFIDAHKKMTEKIKNTDSSEHYLAESQGRTNKPLNVSQNGDQKQSIQAVRIANRSGRNPIKDALNGTPIESSLDGHLKFFPVLRGSGSVQALQEKLKDVVSIGQLKAANAMSSMDLQGVERFSQTPEAFQFYSKIKKLQNDSSKWNSIKRNLTTDDNANLDKLMEIVKSHHRSLDLRKLKEY